MNSWTNGTVRSNKTTLDAGTVAESKYADIITHEATLSTRSTIKWTALSGYPMLSKREPHILFLLNIVPVTAQPTIKKSCLPCTRYTWKWPITPF